MANDYLVSKWKQWFGVLDVNKDGVLSEADTVISKETFANLHHLDDASKTEMGSRIEKWWSASVLRTAGREVSQQDFVDDLNKDLAAGKDQFVVKMKARFIGGFGIIDVNNDGFISEDEFVVMFRAFGHKDETMMKNMYQSLGPKDGLIAVDAMAQAWADFASVDDASESSPIKAALDKEVK